MIEIFDNFDIRGHITFRTPGIVSRFITVTDTEQDLPRLFDPAGPYRLNPDDVTMLGGGSNSLFAGELFRGTVIHLDSPRQVEIVRDGDKATVRADASMVLDELVGTLADAGLWGTENLAAIPGSVGGATVQNAGAYGAEMADTLRSVRCFDMVDRRFVDIPASECGFAYRHSCFKTDEARHRYIIIGVVLELSVAPRPRLSYGTLAENVPADPSPLDVAEAVRAIRAAKLPSVDEVGSAGSYFRNPVVGEELVGRIAEVAGERPSAHPAGPGMVKLSAAWLIDRAGMKGVRRGAVGTWPTQPLVLVNYGGGEAAEVLALQEEIQRAVESRFGVRLEPEVCVYTTRRGC